MKNKLSEIIFILTLAICSNTYITTPCRATMLLPIPDKVPPSLNKSIKLFSAVRAGDPEATKLAIRSGADVDMPDIGGYQALHIAAKYENDKILKNLLSAKPNRAKKDCCSNTALLYAIENNRPKNIQLLLEQDSIKQLNAQDVYGNTVLHYIAMDNNIVILRLLLPYYIPNAANMNIKNMDGDTPLHCAVQYNCLEIVDILTKLPLGKIKINETNADGFTPLHEAAFRGNIDIVKTLTNNNANPYCKDKYNNTPLHIALMNEKLDVAAWLEPKTISRDPKNSFGNTADDIKSIYGYASRASADKAGAGCGGGGSAGAADVA